MSKPSLKLENLNAFKNCGALIPLPQPNIQPNTSILHKFQLQLGFTTKIYSADSWEQ